MRVYLDDKRPAAAGWELVKTSKEAIAMLKTETVDKISLDHDLGSIDPHKTGYEVLLWIEREVVNNSNYIPPIIYIHTSNPPAAMKMHAAVRSIKRLVTLRKRR